MEKMQEKQFVKNLQFKIINKKILKIYEEFLNINK